MAVEREDNKTNPPIMARTNTNSGGSGGGVVFGDQASGFVAGEIQYVDQNGNQYGDTEHTIDSVTGFSSLNASLVGMSDVTYTHASGSTGGPSDVSQTGGYTGPSGAVYTVTIASTGTGASFDWTCSTGGSGTGVVITGDPQPLNNGFTVEGNQGGSVEPGSKNYFVGDQFSWTADNLTASQNTGLLFIPGPNATLNGSINSLYDSTAGNIALTGVVTIGQVGIPGSIGELSLVGSNIGGSGQVGIQQLSLNVGQVFWSVGVQDKATNAGSDIGVSSTSVVLNTQDASGNHAGVNFVTGGNTFFTNQDGGVVSWDDQNNNPNMQLYVGSNPIFDVGDLTGYGNSTIFQVNDQMQKIRGFSNEFQVWDPTFSYQYFEGNANGRNPQVTLGDVTGVGNGTQTVIDDSAKDISSTVNNGTYQVKGFGGIPTDRILYADNANRKITLGDYDYDWNGNSFYVDDLNSLIAANLDYSAGSFVIQSPGGGPVVFSASPGSGNPSVSLGAVSYGNYTNLQITDATKVAQMGSTSGNAMLYMNGATGQSYLGDYEGNVNGTGILVDDSADQISYETGFNRFYGGMGYDLTQVSGSYSASTSDYYVTVDTTSNPATVTLPTPTNEGTTYVVSDLYGNAASNSITVFPPAGSTINGASSYVISQNYGSVTLQWNRSLNYSAVASFASGGGTVYPANQVVFGDGSTAGGITDGNFLFTPGINPSLEVGDIVGSGNQTRLSLNDTDQYVRIDYDIPGFQFAYGHGTKNQVQMDDGTGIQGWNDVTPTIAGLTYGSTTTYGVNSPYNHAVYSSGTGAATLNPVSAVAGSVLTVSDFLGIADTSPITVDFGTGNTVRDPVNGISQTFTINTPFDSFTAQCIDGTNWMVI